MKFLKSVFGSKTKKKPNYDANTLAEANGSPDLRLATAKEKEADIPKIKQEPVKKIPKKSETSASNKTKSTTQKSVDAKSESATTAKKASTKTVAHKVKISENSAAAIDEKATTKSKTTARSNAEKVAEATKTTAKRSAPKATVKSENKPSEADKKTEISASVAKNQPKPQVVKKAEKLENLQDNTDDFSEEATVLDGVRRGKFEIKKSKDGRYVFNLYASNNVIIATSQVYSSSTSAMNGIKSVIQNTMSAPVEDQTLKNAESFPFPKWELYLDKSDHYRFRLCASNGSCVCHSQGYTSKANCKKGIESIIKFAPGAEIIKAYLTKKDSES